MNLFLYYETDDIFKLSKLELTGKILLSELLISSPIYVKHNLFKVASPFLLFLFDKLSIWIFILTILNKIC
jgi:hypothetical protein